MDCPSELESACISPEIPPQSIPAPPKIQPLEVTIDDEIITYPGVGETIDRYELMKVLGHGMYGAAYQVRSQGGSDDVMKIHMQEFEDDLSFKTEIKVLKKVKRLAGFPYLHDVFGLGDLRCLVMSNAGVSVETAFKRDPRTKSCSTENVLRLGYQVCMLVESLHNAGYFHRDIHYGNVMVKLNPEGILKAMLIDFGQSKAIAKAHEPDTCNLKTWSASFQVFRGQQFKKVDDYVSIVYLLADCLGENPCGNNEEKFERRKSEFHQDPSSKINKAENEWIADMYVAVECGRRKDIVNMDRILNVLRRVIPGFDITSDLEFYKDGENIYCR